MATKKVGKKRSPKHPSKRRSEWEKWLLSPVAPAEAKLMVEVGKDAILTPELKASLEQLSMMIYRGELAGTSSSSMVALEACQTPRYFACKGFNDCKVYSREPCAQLIVCKIEVQE
jgi:hypothetical protein